MAVRELIFPISQILQRRQDAADVWNFLGVLYATQEKIGTNELWNREFINGVSAFSKNAYVQGVIAKRAHSFPRRYEDIWDEFQIMMNDIYGVLDPIPLAAALDPTLYDYYLENAGVFEQDIPGGPYTTDLVASDATVLASGLTTPNAYADAWNDLLVPYEATLGNEVKYITPLLGASSSNFYRMSSIRNDIKSGLFY